MVAGRTQDENQDENTGRGERNDASGCRHAHNHERHHRWRDQVRQHLEEEGREHWLFGGRRFAACCMPGGPPYLNPFVGMMLSKGGGVLPLLVLHLIAQGHRYGNEIMREIAERSKGTWAGNPGAVYPLLRLLERQGLVIGEWEDSTKRTRRMYELTKEGLQEYATLKELVQPGLREAIEVMRALFSELYAEQV